MKNINNIFKFPYKIAHTQKREILSHFYKYLDIPSDKSTPDYHQSISFKERDFSTKLFNGITIPYQLKLFNEEIQIGPAKEYLFLLEGGKKTLACFRLIENIFTNHPNKTPFIFTHFKKFEPNNAPIYDTKILEENSLLLGTFLLSVLSHSYNGALSDKILKRENFNKIDEELFEKPLSKEKIEKIINEQQLHNIIRTSCTGEYLPYLDIFGEMKGLERRPDLKEISNILPYDNFEMSQPKKINTSPNVNVINLATNALKNDTLSSSSIQKII